MRQMMMEMNFPANSGLKTCAPGLGNWVHWRLLLMERPFNTCYCNRLTQGTWYWRIHLGALGMGASILAYSEPCRPQVMCDNRSTDWWLSPLGHTSVLLACSLPSWTASAILVTSAVLFIGPLLCGLLSAAGASCSLSGSACVLDRRASCTSASRAPHGPMQGLSPWSSPKHRGVT